MSIFDYYPRLQYNSNQGINILVEPEIVTQYLNDYNKFYSYTIKGNERADAIAYQEYNDPTLDWVIYLTNKIVDPYKDWLMDDNSFKDYMETKYNTTASRLNSTLSSDTIAYYYYKGLNSDDQATINSYNYKMTPLTYSKLGNPPGWEPVSIWEYEYELNELKRDIKLLRPNYISDFKQQIKDLFNG
jgi:Base plate wedge protein 53